ncbi:hypothetical protein RJT34_11632 [Clitoria ternatea]|uniref:TF-B3 domain-containing protein n=1 Tax=Clitoria ternatea TaxID=43366 RepID=A0AAN9PKN9_CLITE
MTRLHYPTTSLMAKGCTNNTYEEARKQRLAENKKRFEDLGISTISKNLAEITSPAKKTPCRVPKLKPKTNDVVELRRSSRVRTPIASYQYDVGIELPRSRKRSRSNSSTWGSFIARPLDEIKEATDEERICALEAAEALQINLKSSNPSFIKSMVRSHVYSCFWLGLPSRFCEDHLPKIVYDMILEDENGSEYKAVYIGTRNGLSGGWRAFALDHKLDDGDALVFELIEAARFKIYIVRAFPDSVEEEENICGTNSPKSASNSKAESNKTKKPKRALVYETKESESSTELLPESSSDKVIQQEVNPTKTTRISQKKTQKKSEPTAASESKGEAVTKTEKPKASKEQSNNDIGDSDAVKPKGANRGKKNGVVQDAGSKVEKVETSKEANGGASQKPRKKRTLKFLRKKA